MSQIQNFEYHSSQLERSPMKMKHPAKRQRRSSIPTKKTSVAKRYRNVPINVAATGKKFTAAWNKTHQTAFNAMQTCTLRAVDVRQFTCAALSTNTQSFPLNNVFATGTTGGQPAGFAKWMAIYTKAYVKAAKITAKFNLSNVTAASLENSPVQFGLTLSTNNTAFATLYAALEPGLVDWKQCYQAPDGGTVTLSVDVAKFMQVDDIMDGSQFYCTSAAGPAQLVYAQLWINNPNNVGTAYSTQTIVIDYDVVFADPVPTT